LGIREITGYVAHVLLAGYWLWVVLGTVPQLRRGARDKRVRTQVLLIKTAAVVLTSLIVGLIHFWATYWWQVALALPIAVGLGMALHRAYRRLVAPPRHRRPLTQRGRTFQRSYTTIQARPPSS
jgi:membrane protein implicated in regulation of membrane protease activity